MDAESSAGTLSVASSDGEREHIRRACHHHPLKLISSKLVQKMCDICKITLPQEQMWGCTESRCKFGIHNSCLDCLPETVQLKSGSRLEDWSLYSPYDYQSRCIDCDELLHPEEVAFKIGRHDGVKSLCIRCCLGRKLKDDDSSLPVPLSINHFFHPCKLYLKFSPSSTCNACFLNHHHLSYYCNYCVFFLDFECAQISKDSHVDDLNQIHHFCHWHPLQLFPEEAIDTETLCKICESSSSSSSSSSISDPFYGCTLCQFYAHKSCMHFLPRKTVHPSLYETLVLLTLPSYVCQTCRRACSGLTFYWAGEILEQKYFCVKCILWPRSEFGDDGGFESIHHRHELTFREVVDDEYVCFMCARDCSGWIYVCSKCSIYCHKSCAEMPRELLHPIHPHYPLTCSVLDTSERVKCNLCDFPSFRFSSRFNRNYRCGSCRFFLDSYCASQSFIQYEGHPHPVYVTNFLAFYMVDCYKCSKPISKYSTVLQCATCDFTLHLECGPLPSKIKDPLHAHALTFQEYYVEDNMSDKFACHICEEKRNPRRPVYMCTQGCLMTCEVECVLEEVVASLRGKRGVLELETVYPKVACKLITIDSNLKEITCASSGKNVARDVPIFSLEGLIELAKPDFESEPLEEGSNKSNSGILDLRGDNSSQSEYDRSSYPYTRKDLKEFIRKIEGNQGIGFEWNGFGYIFSQLEGSSIGGDYMLPNTLDSVYRNFFAKHTIFGPNCKLNHNSRRLIVFYICSILHDMRMTKLVDVSAEKITLWSSALKAVRKLYNCNGLELDFLFKHVTRIAEDHYMVRAVDIMETTFSNLCNNKKELSTRKERLIRELAETESQIEDNNEEMRSFRAYRAAGASQTKKEYYASLDNKWRPCYECCYECTNKRTISHKEHGHKI